METLPFLASATLIDATHTFSSQTPIWPGSNKVLVCPTHSGDYQTEAYVLAGGTGTHTDSPKHFIQDGRSISDLTAAELVSPLALIDVESKVEFDPDYALSKADIIDWESKHGILPKGSMVVMKTGWSHRWNEETKFLNTGSDGKMHFPGFSAEAASFLITERDIHGIAIDTLSLDVGISEDFAVHMIILGAGKYQIENVDLRDPRIPPTGAWIIASPMKLEGAPEAPTRVLIVVPKTN
jgi:kynurenine formamidase